MHRLKAFYCLQFHYNSMNKQIQPIACIQFKPIINDRQRILPMHFKSEFG